MVLEGPGIFSYFTQNTKGTRRRAGWIINNKLNETETASLSRLFPFLGIFWADRIINKSEMKLG